MEPRHRSGPPRSCRYGPLSANRTPGGHHSLLQPCPLILSLFPLYGIKAHQGRLTAHSPWGTFVKMFRDFFFLSFNNATVTNNGASNTQTLSMPGEGYSCKRKVQACLETQKRLFVTSQQSVLTLCLAYSKLSSAINFCKR